VSLSTVKIYKSELYKVSIFEDTKKEEEEVAVSLDSRIEVEHRRQKVKKQFP
jgi:hypothetical protein